MEITIRIYDTHTGYITATITQYSWRRALEMAYATILGNPARVAHIYPANTTLGLYIARHDDPQRAGWTDLDTMARRAEAKFSVRA